MAFATPGERATAIHIHQTLHPLSNASSHRSGRPQRREVRAFTTASPASSSRLCNYHPCVTRDRTPRNAPWAQAIYDYRHRRHRRQCGPRFTKQFIPRPTRASKRSHVVVFRVDVAGLHHPVAEDLAQQDCAAGKIPSCSRSNEIDHDSTPRTPADFQRLRLLRSGAEQRGTNRGIRLAVQRSKRFLPSAEEAVEMNTDAENGDPAEKDSSRDPCALPSSGLSECWQIVADPTRSRLVPPQ